MRFVLLRHWLPGEPHFDLLWEDGRGMLRGWAFSAAWPHPGWQSARPLPPHRGYYLRGQGPAGVGRGWVQRRDDGTLRLLADQPDFVCLALRGRGGDWLAEFVSSPSEPTGWRCRAVRSG